MSTQPDLDSLNAQRIYEKFRDLAALGLVVRIRELDGLPMPDTHNDIHRLAGALQGPLAALGWVIEKSEARGLPVPSYDELHRMADEWKATHP